MKRKPIQLIYNLGHLIALADDGTLWRMDAGTDHWRDMRPLPQPEPQGEYFEGGIRRTHPKVAKSDEWPPAGLTGLWAQSLSGTIVEINDPVTMRAAQNTGWLLIEAASASEAELAAKASDRLRFKLDDVEYVYIPAIPF